MARVSDAFPSKYLKGKDLKAQDGTPVPPVKVVIKHVVYEEFQNGDGSWVMYFEGKKKGLILKKTKALLIEDSYGDDMDTWAGKPLVLSCGSTMFQGTRYDTVEITVPQGPSQAAPAPISIEEQQSMGCNDTDPDSLPDGW